MFYLHNQGTTVTQLGFIDKTTHSVDGVAIQSSLHIQTTNYFLANLVIPSSYSYMPLGTLIYPDAKLIVVDVGTIDGDGKIDYKVVGDEIVPSGETNPFVISMEYIDPTQGVIIFTGGIDADATYKVGIELLGWAKILNIHQKSAMKIVRLVIRNLILQALLIV